MYGLVPHIGFVVSKSTGTKCVQIRSNESVTLRNKVCFISQEFLINIYFFISFIQICIKGYFFGEKEIFIYVTQETFYNIVTSMVCLFRSLFSPLCGFFVFHSCVDRT